MNKCSDGRWLWRAVTTIAAAASVHQAAWAAGPDCDRACLKGLADQVLQSMVAHDPTPLPVTVPYAATENGKASILPMMSLWRTPTAVSSKRQYALDVQAGQIFIAAVVQEGGLPSILSARIKVEGGKIAEFEGYITRSKSDTGWHFNPAGVDTLPSLWTASVPEAARASRAQLQRAAQAAWDASVSVPVSAQCHVIENGDNLGQEGLTCSKIANPTDAHARTVVIDPDMGIAVAIGHMQGTVAQGGAFIPESMMAQIRQLPTPPPGAEFKTIMREAPAADTVIVVDKYFGGQLQGQQAFMYIQGPSALPVWTGSSRP